MTTAFQWIPGRYVIEFDDVHRLQVNFYTLYPGQTLRFFGSLLARDLNSGAEIRLAGPGETARRPSIDGGVGAWGGVVGGPAIPAGMGIGMGIKKFQAVIIFNDAAALDRFITTGFDASAQADLAAKSADDGKVVVSEAANADFQKVKMYQLTEKGVAVQATMQGYKYWPDDDHTGTQ